jgi:hypothetical protein
MLYHTMISRENDNAKKLMKFTIYPLKQYEEWFQTQTEKSKLQIEKRLDMIK